MALFGKSIPGLSNIGNMGDLTSMFGDLGSGLGDFASVFEKSTDPTDILGDIFNFGDIGGSANLMGGSAFGFGKSENEGFGGILGLGEDNDLARPCCDGKSLNDDNDGRMKRENTTYGTRVYRLTP